jgi:hypothetical protein
MRLEIQILPYQLIDQITSQSTHTCTCLHDRHLCSLKQSDSRGRSEKNAQALDGHQNTHCQERTLPCRTVRTHTSEAELIIGEGQCCGRRGWPWPLGEEAAKERRCLRGSSGEASEAAGGEGERRTSSAGGEGSVAAQQGGTLAPHVQIAMRERRDNVSGSFLTCGVAIAVN